MSKSKKAPKSPKTFDPTLNWSEYKSQRADTGVTTMLGEWFAVVTGNPGQYVKFEITKMERRYEKFRPKFAKPGDEYILVVNTKDVFSGNKADCEVEAAARSRAFCGEFMGDFSVDLCDPEFKPVDAEKPKEFFIVVCDCGNRWDKREHTRCPQC